MLSARNLVQYGLFISLLGLLAACSTNPVTGAREFNLVSESQERAIGHKNYEPYRQAQGGDYVADPDLVAYVQSVGQRIAKVSDRKLDYEFHVVNDSTPNAWALPGGKIAINRGLLLELKNEAELAAVLAHEVIHAAARHSAKSMERGIFMQGAVLAAGVALANSRYRQAGMLGVNLGSGLATMHYSREAEREADHYGIRYMVRAGYDPQAAVGLQQTFVRLSEDHQPGWLEGLFASHPPSPERVENNRQLVDSLGNPGGRLGEQDYQQATKHLRQTQPAYAAYDKGVQALNKGNAPQALRLANQALRIEPNEALFHALRGDIREYQGRDTDALTNYNRALRHNPDYFRFHLSRGLLRQKLNQTDMAKHDLQRSTQLLPTTEAYWELGRIAEAAGQKSLAIQHLSKAATAKSKLGGAAGMLLARLELADRPEKYIRANLDIGRRGDLLIRVKNTSPVKAHKIRLILGEQAGAGIREIANFQLREMLSPGQEVILRPHGSVQQNALRHYRVFVDSAQVIQ